MNHVPSTMNYKDIIGSPEDIAGSWTQEEFRLNVNSNKEIPLVYEVDCCNADFFINVAAGLVQVIKGAHKLVEMNTLQ